MTTIVGVQGENFAVVAFDSLVTEGEKKFILPRSMPKVVRRGNSLLGAAGDLRVTNLLSSSRLPNPSEKLSGKKLDAWVGKTFIPALRTAFVTAGYDDDGEQASVILASFNAVIYEIGNSYEFVRDARGLYGIGTGSSFALGHLVGMPGMRKNISLARAAARAAVEIATQFDSGSSHPVHVLEDRRKFHGP